MGLDIYGMTCTCCGGTLHVIGESVSEMLDWIPAQLRVIRTDGAPLHFADALVRGLASIFSLAVLGIGALWILQDPERQAWHDKIAGTYVVKVPRNWPL